ncbi:universal bacterial protein YeaZ [gut metagenome]|uniref:Universal bacterial protein YeaZ n=1 Tax=gut metagenome TaxID=749906 RepID=J9CH44_9ZZZZ
MGIAVKSLFMDTAWKNLILVLCQDGQVVASVVKEAFKKQSETMFVELQTILDQVGWKLADIQEVVITDGPGSYTGLRLAMTTAKLMGTQANVIVKTISTLQLYAGVASSANVILDARGGRAYVGHIEAGQTSWMGILPLDEVENFLVKHPGDLYGEGELIDQVAKPSDFVQNVVDLLPLAKTVENVHALVPAYMKESDSYKA